MKAAPLLLSLTLACASRGTSTAPPGEPATECFHYGYAGLYVAQSSSSNPAPAFDAAQALAEQDVAATSADLSVFTNIPPR